MWTGAQLRHSWQQRTGVELLEVGVAAEGVGDGDDGLGEVR
jgi:hypothetical protein